MRALSFIGGAHGVVVIRAEGYFTERFINICMHRGIFLRDVHRLNAVTISAVVSADDFCLLRPIARKTHTKIKVVSKRGLPFFLNRYKKRRFAAVGAAIFIAIIWYCSSHIMGIEISGNERIKTETVIQSLKDYGVYTGASVGKIDKYLVQNQMMTRLDDVAWIGVNIKGSKIYIEIKERLNTAIEPSRTAICNLVAAKDGQIELMEVKDGQNMVKVGDVVEKGDLLVSGAIDSSSQGARFVHAYGEVYAKTMYKKSKDFSLEYIEKKYTGKRKKRYSVGIADKKLRLYINNRIPFENSDKKEDVKEFCPKIQIFPSAYLYMEEYDEFEPQKKKMTEKEAAEKGKKELSSLLRGEIPKSAEIISKNSSYISGEDGKITVTVEFECRENIAVSAPIDKTIDKTENMNYDISNARQ